MVRLGLLDAKQIPADAAAQLPDEEQATLTVLAIYLQEIVDGGISPHLGMQKIDRDLTSRLQITGPRSYPNPLRKPDRSTKQRFVGEELGVEYLYAWWRELRDALDGDTVLYYTDLPLAEAVRKFEGHIIDEADKRLAQLIDGGPRR